MVDFKKMYEGSYYTIIGCGGDIEEWKKGYTDLMNKEGIGSPKEFIMFKGSEITKFYDLKGDDAFSDDLTFLVFPLEGLNVSKLAIFRLRMEDVWFDDLIDNTLGRYDEK